MRKFKEHNTETCGTLDLRNLEDLSFRKTFYRLVWRGGYLD